MSATRATVRRAPACVVAVRRRSPARAGGAATAGVRGVRGPVDYAAAPGEANALRASVDGTTSR